MPPNPDGAEKMPLTDVKIRNAKPTEKPFRLFDGQGLYLEVAPTGGKLWRFKYRFDGKEKRLGLGRYPATGLREARQGRDDLRALLQQGIDPGARRKADKIEKRILAGNSFELVGREWYGKFSPDWAATYQRKILSSLDRDLFPWIGSRPIAEIAAPELLAAARRVESRGALHTAHRVIRTAGQIFRYAVAAGYATRDPSGDLRGALPPAKGTHFASITDPARVGELLRMIDGYTGTPTVCAALKLAPLVFVRPGELRKAEWTDIDLDRAEWRYRVTKTDQDHIVPLSTQAVAILTDLHPLTGRGRYAFPSARGADRPMSDNALLAALRRLGIPKDEMSGHGFRAMARTILDEVLGFRPDFIEHQLAHAVRDPNGRSYNRTSHLESRKLMMQAWSNYLDGVKAGGNVVAFKKAG
ncbi:tyrosine-type recombinase/integrase [Thiocystis violascens]|uniref:Integrase n=1 Tax=Thiocystis violascens (strain ATCC 17096 / DSM 198 / 6111) TaxID=765911 RepID=I3YBD9_THIV6|nr:integrase arm-type DNA-binding domain-containing protein [Thiocystis violascens]AFL74307.1 Integrase [Thiocystis violascens DSM 198]